jgi:N-terminal domain of anti-restriction factor ArdC
MSAQSPYDWSALLVDAVTRPGIISSAYSRFWNYSVGNQILAFFQCLEKRIEPGPIHTFKGWLDLGRHVRKGEKAITLCMPVSVKRKLSKSKLEPQPANVGGDAERQSSSAGSVIAIEDGTVS